MLANSCAAAATFGIHTQSNALVTSKIRARKTPKLIRSRVLSNAIAGKPVPPEVRKKIAHLCFTLIFFYLSLTAVLVEKAATVVQTRYLEPSWRGSFLLIQRLNAIVAEAIEWDNERKLKKNRPKDEILSSGDEDIIRDIIRLLCAHEIIYPPTEGGAKYSVAAEHRDPIWEAREVGD